MPDNAAEIFFGLYKLFNSPPNTPKELKCIGCKVATAGLSFATAGAFAFGIKRSLTRGNAFIAMAFGGVATILVASGALFSRMAYDDDKYNKQLVKNYRKEIKAKRLEKVELDNKSSLQAQNS